jgi:purine-binding chemotaxis protein CheW
MKTFDRLVTFVLDRQRYALDLSSVEKVVRAVEVTPLPKAPGIVSGVINMRGRVVPVFDIRKRFGLPERELALSDQMIIANTSGRTVSLAVEQVEGTMERSTLERVMPGKILPEMEYVEGVVKLDDGMVFIHDLDRFLSLEEEKELDDALREGGQG